MLLREGVPHMDGNFCKKRMVHYLNLELADTLGNIIMKSSWRLEEEQLILLIICLLTISKEYKSIKGHSLEIVFI